MQKRQLMVVGIVLVVATILFAITTYRQQAQDKSQTQQDEITIVKKGQITDKEREYSKEFKKLYWYRKGKKLGEISELSKARGNKQEIGVTIGIGDLIHIGNTPLPTKLEFLSQLSCKADAVVVGSTKSKVAHLTEDETFVYTEYEFSVQNILKNNSAFPIEVNSNIQITRPGGLIKLDDQVIRAEDLSYTPLQKNKEYLLFLRFVPAANGYVVSSEEGDFVLENKSFKKLSKAHVPEEVASSDSQSFLNDVRNSILSRCRQNPTGGNQ